MWCKFNSLKALALVPAQSFAWMLSFAIFLTQPSCTKPIKVNGKSIDNLMQQITPNFSILDVRSNDAEKYVITWQEVAGVKAFDLNIAYDSGCTNTLLSVKNIVASSAEITINDVDTYYACVYAKTDKGSFPASNNGLAFTKDGILPTDPRSGNGAILTPAPTFTSIAWINDAIDGYINAVETTQSNALIGNLVASDYTLADYALVTASTTCDSSLTYSTVPNNTALAALTDTTYKICVRLRNAINDTVYGATTSAITLDKIAPSVDAGADVSTAALFTRNAIVTGASSYLWSKTSGSGTITFGSSTATSTTISVSGDDIYFVRLTATDNAGNVAFDEFVLGWNTPLVPYPQSISATNTNGSYGTGSDIDIVVTFSESVTVTGTPTLKLETGSTDRTASYHSGSPGAAITFRYTVQTGDVSTDLDAHNSSDQISLSGGTIVATSGGAASLLTVPTGANVSSLASQKNLLIDGTAPTSASSLITAADSASGSDVRYDDDTTIYFAWTAGSDAESGIASYTLKRYAQSACGGASTNTTGLTTTSQSYTGTTGTTYSFEVVTINGAGLSVTSSCSGDITIDTTAPIAASSLITAADAAGGADTRVDDDTTIYFAWTAGTDAESNIASYTLKRYDQASCAGSATDTTGITGTSTSFTGVNGTTYSFKVVTINNAGLSTTSVCSGDITIDMTAPSVTGLSNSTTPVQSKTWNWGCSEASCTYRYVIDTTSNTAPGGAYSATVTDTQNTGTGTYYIHVQAKDAAGNESAVAHYSAEIDNSAPTVSAVAVQTTLTIDVTFSEAMSTGVTVAANYTLSGTGQGTLAATPNSVALVSGNKYRLTWSSGEMLQGGDITITVATAQDVAGNAVASDGTHTGGGLGTAPSVTGLSNSTTPVQSKTWNWGCSEASCTYRYTVDTTSNTAPAGAYGATVTATQNTGTGTYYIHVQAKDAAGNESAVAHYSAEIDNSAPTVSTVVTQTSLTVDVTFSEAMGTGVTTAANYTLSGTGKGTLAATPNSVALVSGNKYRLTWSSGEMLNGGDITIAVANAQDVAGNVIASNATETGGGIGTAPTSPPALIWTVSSPAGTLVITASWTVSAASDLANQKIQFYADATCSTTTGALIDLNSASTATRNFTGVDGGDYTYKIQSIDSAGNAAYSTCSSAMHITYVAPPSGLSYSAPTAIYLYNDASSSLTADITANTKTVTGSVTSYSISPNLNTNTGLTFNTSTGTISGKPTLTSAATDYTITATNPGGSTTAVVNIRTAPGFLVNSTADHTDNSTADNKCETSAGNGSVCTLRAALVQANAMSTTARMIIVPAGTITTGSTLPISKNIELTGASEATTIIDGNAGAYRVFTVSGAGMAPSISKMTIQNSTGGGVSVTNAHLTMDSVTVQNHTTTTSGAGIYGGNPSTLTLNRVSILNNTANSGGSGALTCFTNSVCYLSNLTVKGNSATGSGGGIANFGTMTLSSSYLADNQTSVTGGGGGGGIFAHNSSVSTTVTNTTIYRNYASRGAAVMGSNVISLTNCTVASNSVFDFSGLYGPLYSLITTQNSIFYNNRASTGEVRSCGTGVTLVTNGNNLSDTALTDCNFNAAGDLVSSNALLSLPANNGGYTWTMSPTTGSPAIDAGSSVNAPSVDQRNVARPVGVANDIGAYEGSATGTPMDITPPNAATAVGWSVASPSASTSLTATWTVSNSAELSSQRIVLFTGSSCALLNAISPPVTLASAATNSYTFTGTSGTSYTYKIMSYDAVGNFLTTACSPAMTVQ